MANCPLLLPSLPGLTAHDRSMPLGATRERAAAEREIGADEVHARQRPKRGLRSSISVFAGLIQWPTRTRARPTR
jgi:hypothetical protein